MAHESASHAEHDGRSSFIPGRAFLFGLGFGNPLNRPDGEQTRAVAVNWDADEESELDERISQMINDALDARDDLDEIAAYCRIFPETILYQPETGGIE